MKALLRSNIEKTIGQTITDVEFDALTIRSNAAREAYGYQVQGAGFGADAALRESFQPSYLGAGASLLSGASSLASKWDMFKRTSPGGSTPDYGSGISPNA